MLKICSACGGLIVAIAMWSTCLRATAAVTSPVSTALIVGLDSSSALTNANGNVKVWYDQIADGGNQDFGQQTDTLQPKLLTNYVMPNGLQQSVIQFVAATNGATGNRLDSMDGTASRALTIDDVFTAGSDSVYGNQAAQTWFVVFKNDVDYGSLTTSNASRGIFGVNFDSPSNVRDIQTNVQRSGSGATGTVRILVDSQNVPSGDTQLPQLTGQVNSNWLIVAVQRNGSDSDVNGVAAHTLNATILRQDGLTSTASGSVSGTFGNHIISSLGQQITSGGFLSNTMAELLYYNTSLDNTQTTDVINYLNNKYFVPQTVPGDFDSDGDVDGADFIVWQTHYPTMGGATLTSGDANGDGNVDGADFAAWQTSFPLSPSTTTAVPEPGAILLAALGLIGLGATARRKR